MFGFSGMNLFMFLMFYLVHPIIYFSAKNEWKPKKNIMLGVTLPSELIHSDEVKAVGQWYRKTLDRWTLWVVLLGLPAIFLKHLSVSLTWDMLWILAVIIYPQVIYVQGWKQLRQIKRDHGYEPVKQETQEIMVDLTAIAELKKEPSPWWYLPPALMTLIPCGAGLSLWGDRSFWWNELIYLTMFGCILLFFGFTYRAFRRQKVEMVNHVTELTVALTEVRRHNWHKMMLGSAWMTGLFTLAVWLLAGNVLWILVLTGLYTIGILVLAVHTEFSVRRAQERLSAKYITDRYTDEDEYWLWGSVYYNPKDKHMLKNARTGMSMTINLATTGGKIYMLFGVIVLLAMPFIGFWLIAEEFTPAQVRLEEETLVASHLKDVYVISLDEITSVNVIDELPPAHKDVGTGMDTLLKGQFRVDGFGVCQLLLNPQADEFVVVTTDEETYIFSVEPEIGADLSEMME